MEKTFENQFNDNMNERPLTDIVNEWRGRADDSFGTQIRVICEQTKEYFKGKYYTNPVDSFVWFYGISGDKEKTYEKVEAYMLHSPDLMASMNPTNVNLFYKALRNMRMIIDNEKIQD